MDTVRSMDAVARLGCLYDAEAELELRGRVRMGTGCVCDVVASTAPAATWSWYCGFVELEDMDAVLATEELCARRAVSSRVSLLTCIRLC